MPGGRVSGGLSWRPAGAGVTVAVVGWTYDRGASPTTGKGGKGMHDRERATECARPVAGLMSGPASP